MADVLLPIFPLHTVLFPGGPLALRLFEPRYLDMISRCLQGDGRFGVCLIREGHEVGPTAVTFEVGTRVRITDWHRRADGLLGVTVLGEQRFRIDSAHRRDDGLLEAGVELLPNEPATPVPAGLLPMVELLRRVLESAGPLYAAQPTGYDDAVWVGARLVELLPFSLAVKQHLLEMDGAVARLERVAGLLEQEETGA